MSVQASTTIRPSSKTALERAGYFHYQQLQECSPVELAADCKVSLEEAVLILETVSTELGMSQPLTLGVSAHELWRQEIEKAAIGHQKITTFCHDLDQLLDGGFSLGHLSEICGEPGAGKTQMCLQLACSVRLPQSIAGMAGKCLYVDTEGSFIAGRFREIAQASVSQVQQIAHQQHAGIPLDLRREADAFTVQSIMDNTLYYRIHQLLELIAFIHTLPCILQADPGIKLIIIDSIAFHFRNPTIDFAQRSRLAYQIGQRLQAISQEHQVAVIVSNQMTTRLDPLAANEGAEARRTELVPALGDAWAHSISVRLVLQQRSLHQPRVASLEKSPALPRGQTSFAITSKGIRGPTETL